MRCFQNRAGTNTATIEAGTELGFVAETSITHFGPVQFYMAKVPDSANINTWDPSGNVWFKAASISARGSPLGSGVETWPAYRTFPCSVVVFRQGSLTALQRNRQCLSLSRRTRPPASIWCVSSPSRYTKRRMWAAHRCICLVRRSRLRVVGVENRDRLLLSLVRIM
jgi:hypothetical protein